MPDPERVLPPPPPRSRAPTARDFLAALLAIPLGIAATCLPAYVRGEQPMASPLFPWIRTGVETIGQINLWLLLAAGLVLGLLFGGRGSRPFWRGLATMGAFPIVTLAEGIADPTSHNLWPLEFGMYFFFGLFAAAGAYAGAYAGAFARRRLARAGPRA